MIKALNLKKTYGEKTVLELDELCVSDGEALVIVGPNGSGKSTLLKILAGVIEPTQGSVEGVEGLRYVPQQSYAFKRTVLENCMLSAEGSRKEKQRKSLEILERLGLSELADKKATGLSGGEKQRLAIARALVEPCRLLLLDEPTASADVEAAELIEDTLAQYKKATSCTIIMTTHSPKAAMGIADRVLIMNKGRRAELGTPEQVLRAPESAWAKSFIAGWSLDEN